MDCGIDTGALRASFNPPPSLPADPFAREEAWIASGTGETFHEFVASREAAAKPPPPPAPPLRGGLRLGPPPDAGIYFYR